MNDPGMIDPGMIDPGKIDPADNPVLLSIIIPTLNESTTIKVTLQRLQCLREQGVELIVVDGGSDDGCALQLSELADVVLTVEKGRARQMNAGADSASGQWLLFLHADTVLPEPLSKFLTMLKLTDSNWGFFLLKLSGKHIFFRVIERAINLRSRLTRVATGDQSFFIRRELFSKLGRYPDIPLMEDVALCKSLRSFCRPVIWPSPVLTSSRRWEQYGIIRTVFLMWRLRLAYFLGVSPDRLVRSYYGK